MIPLPAAPEIFTREVFDALPNSFVVKANHGSTYVEVVRDKSTRSFEQLSQLATHWADARLLQDRARKTLSRDQARIFFERLLLDNSGRGALGGLQAALLRRAKRKAALHLYSRDLRQVRRRHARRHLRRRLEPFSSMAIGAYKPSPKPAPRPENLDAILAAATTLCGAISTMFADLYAPDNQIYFGELTFTPGARRAALHARPDRLRVGPTRAGRIPVDQKPPLPMHSVSAAQRLPIFSAICRSSAWRLGACSPLYRSQIESLPAVLSTAHIALPFVGGATNGKGKLICASSANVPCDPMCGCGSRQW